MRQGHGWGADGGRTRRALAGGAALGGAGAVLAACAPAGGSAPADTAAAPTAVSYMIYAGEEERRAWEATREGFQKASPRDKLEIIYAPINDPTFNYDEKLRAMMAAGNAPDTVRVAVR